LDASGLAWGNRVTAAGIVRLLGQADREPWGRALRESLPRPGEGTLWYRLHGLKVRAKTGTLGEDVSALSGYVWLDSRDAWARFSILSRGMSKTRAVRMEDRIVRTLARHAR
jgi:D-alanyl-D-alanine carboxypeptidase